MENGWDMVLHLLNRFRRRRGLRRWRHQQHRTPRAPDAAKGQSRFTLMVALLVVFALAAVVWQYVAAHDDRTPRGAVKPPALEDSAQRAEVDRPDAVREPKSGRALEPMVGEGSTKAAGRDPDVLTVTVSRQDGAVLPATKVLATFTAQKLELLTGQDGTATIPLAEASPPLELTATLEGFASRSLRYEYSLPHTAAIHLAPQSAITGTVRLSDGSVPPGDIHVLVRVAGDRVSFAQRALSVLAGEPGPQHAVADAHGEFTIDGLRGDASYELIAGGNGLIIAEPISGVRPGAPPIAVTLFPGYVCGVRYVEPDGTLFPRWASMGRGSWNLPEGTHADQVFNVTGSALLAGLTEDLSRYPEINQQFFIDAAAPPSIGPIVLRYEFAGYKPVAASVTAQPVSSGGRVEDVCFTPLAPDWGGVTVQLRNMPAPYEESALSARATSSGQRVFGAILQLDPPGRSRETYYLYRTEGDSWRADHVPCGQYLAHVCSRDGNFSYPPQAAGGVPIEVTRQGTAMDVELSGTGSLEVRLTLQEGSNYTGRAMFVIRPENGQMQEMQLFYHTPYLIPFLAPGEYRVYATIPGGFVGPTGSAQSVIEVGPGSRILAELHEAP